MIIKKNIFTAILFLFVSSLIAAGCAKDDGNPVEENNQEDQPDGYTLLWSDEFEGSSIDAGKWVHEVNGGGGGNNELQYYTDRSENSFVQDGMLHIAARQEEYTGSDGTRYYTSARMNTSQTKSFMYGRVEAKLKLPYGKGLWPAFWMLGITFSNPEVGWPKCGEIDIMEMIGGGDGRDNVTHGTLHWDDNGHKYQGGSTKLASGKLADDFHVYAIEWDENKIDWYFDDNKFYTLDITPEAMSEFHQHFFIILNVAVGGDWPGNPDLTTTWPQEMVVDYVRVYEKE